METLYVRSSVQARSAADSRGEESCGMLRACNRTFFASALSVIFFSFFPTPRSRLNDSFKKFDDVEREGLDSFLSNYPKD